MSGSWRIWHAKVLPMLYHFMWSRAFCTFSCHQSFYLEPKCWTCLCKQVHCLYQWKLGGSMFPLWKLNLIGCDDKKYIQLCKSKRLFSKYVEKNQLNFKVVVYCLVLVLWPTYSGTWHSKCNSVKDD